MLTVIILLSALVLCWLLLPVILPRPRESFPDFDFWLKHPAAHRGLYDVSAGIPENSLAAFDAAARAGFAIELDVRACDDGLVIMHDRTLKRACGVNSRIKNLPLAEIQRNSLYGTAEKVPSLEQTLQLIDGRVPLIIELKDYGVRSAVRFMRALAPVLRAYKGEYCIESFNPWLLHVCRKYLPDAARGQLITSFTTARRECGWFAGWIFSNLLLCPLARPHFVSCEYGNPESRGFAAWKRRGGKSARWAPDTQSEIDALLSAGEMVIFESHKP